MGNIDVGVVLETEANVQLPPLPLAPTYTFASSTARTRVLDGASPVPVGMLTSVDAAVPSLGTLTRGFDALPPLVITKKALPSLVSASISLAL
jgi:hypothetical protein